MRLVNSFVFLPLVAASLLVGCAEPTREIPVAASEPEASATSESAVAAQPAPAPGQQNEKTMMSRDEPFGFSEGMSEGELRHAFGTVPQPVPRVPRMFKLRFAPNSDSYFDTFNVLVGPHSGLCLLLASGPKLSANEVGYTFSAIQFKLDRVYGGAGHPLHPNLTADPKTLSAKWARSSDANTGPKIDSIILGVSEDGEKTYSVVLRYNFANIGSCNA